MDALMAAQSEPMGPGWFTRNEYQQRYGLNRIQARTRLSALESRGKLEMWRGYVSAIKKRAAKYRLKA